MTLSDYLESHSSPVDASLSAIERWAHLHTAQPQMLCGPYMGRLLSLLCRTVRPHCAVEVGAYIGYSTCCVASSLDADATLHSFEVNDEYEGVIRRHLSDCHCADRVRLHIGDAKDQIPAVFPSEEAVVDFAFIDADKRNLRCYYDLLVPRMRRGALLLVDNVLWHEKVLDRELHHDTDTLTIHAFNEYVQHDSRVENLMLGVRDGIMICSVL